MVLLCIEYFCRIFDSRKLECSNNEYLCIEFSYCTQVKLVVIFFFNPNFEFN